LIVTNAFHLNEHAVDRYAKIQTEYLQQAGRQARQDTAGVPRAPPASTPYPTPSNSSRCDRACNVLASCNTPHLMQVHTSMR